METEVLLKRSVLLLVAPLTLILSSCAMPKTAAEYRTLMANNPNSPGVHVEHFEVQRPLGEAARQVKKKVGECLKVTMKRTSTTASGGIPSTAVVFTRYEPFANIAAETAEIYVTETYLNARQEDTGQDRIFMFLLDLAPAGKNKTKADLYYTWGEPRPRTAKAVRDWANGKGTTCPDLAP